MKNELINILSSFGYPVFLQGTLNAEEEYPASFVTFWTDYTADNSHYDDAVHSVDWSFSVIFYSSDPNLVNTVPPQIIAALRSAGFVPQGVGQDIMSDEITHTGWAMDFIFTQILR